MADCSHPFRNAKWSNHVVTSLKKLSSNDRKGTPSILSNIAHRGWRCYAVIYQWGLHVLQAMMRIRGQANNESCPINFTAPAWTGPSSGWRVFNESSHPDVWSVVTSLTVPLQMSKEGFSSIVETGDWKASLTPFSLFLPSVFSFFISSFRLIKVTHWRVASRTHWAPMKKWKTY